MRAIVPALTLLTLLLTGGARLVSQAPSAPAPPKYGQEGKDVEWVPTPDDTAAKMLDLAKVTAKDTVIDLGSGDGKLVIAAAQRGAKGIGVEYDANLVATSIDRAAKAGVAKRTTFMKADLFEIDLSQATVITMFLLPDLNLKLRPTLLALRPGTRIVSNTWDMEEWTPDEVARLDCPDFCNSLLWIVPARVGGAWRLDGGERTGELTLKQTFQMVTGTLKIGTEAIPITSGRLRGEAIEFEAAGTRYMGRATRSGMSGTATAGGRATPWRAQRG
jgi:hypothetical protein